jgi:protein-S-isoprenylcysteine O-methyltransferase Ste14
MERRLVLTFLVILLIPAAFLVLSGDPWWFQGWVFGAWFVLLCYATIWYLHQNDPELLNERYRKPGTGDQERWDLAVVAGLMVGFVTWIVVMPLDAKRFAWSPPFPVWVQLLGVAALTASFYFFFRSYKDNSFLSPLVRYQEEREQKVVSSGVYGIVRHPMYLGGSLMFVGAPLLLGSVLGLLVGATMVALVMARIGGEEALLLRELEGYEEYQNKVRYRMIPYIW